MGKFYPWVWFALAVQFLVAELIPLALKKPQYTLSDYVWRLEEINKGWTFARYFVAAFFLWLALHMVFKLFR